VSSFVRPAAWLRQLFTQSRTESSNPSVLSNDVSLVQPYDGGGIVIPDPANLVHTVDSAVGAATGTTILTTGANEIIRVYSVAVFKLAGADGTANLLTNHTGIALTCGVSGRMVADGNWNAIGTPGVVIGPAHVLTGNFFGGDASSQVRWRLYGARVPVGTVFYV